MKPYSTNSKTKIVGFVVRDENGEYTVKPPTKAKAIHVPEDAYEYLFSKAHVELTDKREHFVCLYLDTRRRPIAHRTISIGTLEASLVHPREVLAPALELRASSLVVAHNHPSGDVDPSPEDLALTERLDRACRLMGIRLVDHLIVTQTGFESIRRLQSEGKTGLACFS